MKHLQTLRKLRSGSPLWDTHLLPLTGYFGNIERQIQRHNVIENLSGYVEIISKFATIMLLGKDCPVHDWKDYADQVIKETWKLAFSVSEK